ncbi:MAG: hypothetical protein JW909_12670 [Planctomycetes bacterium]|nr:hypothetical protein [Planctomycetota bacterium]
MDVLLGMDIGTTKLCATVLDAAGRELLASEETPNSFAVSGDGEAREQDAAGILDAATGLLARIVRKPALSNARIEGIGITGQMHGVVFTDGAGAPVTNLVTWQDGRGCRRAPGTDRTFVEELSRRLGADALVLAGCPPASGFGGVTILRMAAEGVLPAGCVPLTIHDCMVRRLTGVACTDATDAASWGMCDVSTGRWLEGAAEAAGMEESLLPRILPTGSRAGCLTGGAAARTGIPAGTPVNVAVGDNQASFVGSVVSFADSVLFNLGTGGQMSVAVDRFLRVDGLETRPLLPGHWLLTGASLCGGRAYAVLERFFRDVGKMLFGRDAPGSLFDRMNESGASSCNDAGALRAAMLFDGTRRDPSVRGGIYGIDTGNLTAANLIRAFVNGMVGELVDFYRLAENAGVAASHLAGSGNAVRRNPLVRDEIERRMGMRLSISPWREEAACGAAVLAGTGELPGV